jgi:hypothetical protein
MPQDHGLFSHIAGYEVTGIWDLALVTEVKPTAGKDLLAFQLVYLGVGKDAAVYQTAFWINKRLDVHRDASLGF